MNDAVYYKVSYVVEGGRFPGTIINTKQEPQVGDEVVFNGRLFTIVEILELMPPAGDFGLLHATCRYLRDV
jgi:hypothetical protein